MRFLLLCLLIYLGYRVLKALMLPARPSPKPEESKRYEVPGVDDIMVKDPVCQTYFPKRSAIKEVIGGQPHYFCSTACRDKYIEEIGKTSG